MVGVLILFNLYYWNTLIFAVYLDFANLLKLSSFLCIKSWSNFSVARLMFSSSFLALKKVFLICLWFLWKLTKQRGINMAFAIRKRILQFQINCNLHVIIFNIYGEIISWHLRRLNPLISLSNLIKYVGSLKWKLNFKNICSN